MRKLVGALQRLKRTVDVAAISNSAAQSIATRSPEDPSEKRRFKSNESQVKTLQRSKSYQEEFEEERAYPLNGDRFTKLETRKSFNHDDFNNHTKKTDFKRPFYRESEIYNSDHRQSRHSKNYEDRDRNYEPRSEKDHKNRGERSFESRGDRGPRSFENRGERGFENRATRSFESRGERGFENRDKSYEPRGERNYGSRDKNTEYRKPYDRFDRNYEAKGSDHFEKNFDRFDRSKQSKGPRDFSKGDSEVELSPELKHLKQLVASRTNREEYQEVLVPGLVALQELPDKTVIKRIYYSSEDVHDKFKSLVNVDCKAKKITPSQYHEISQERNPNGILAVCKMPLLATWGQTEHKASEKWLGVVGIKDASNLGLLMRATGCLGWNGMVLIGKGHVDPFSINVVRASAGAAFKLPIVRAESVDQLAEAQVFLAEVPQKCEGGGLNEAVERNIEKAMVLVIGSEQNGFEGYLPEKHKYPVISLPISPGYGSLNAALAGSILIHTLS